MSQASFEVADNLFLVRQRISAKTTEPNQEAVPTHHIFVLDTSGSMSSELPKIREQLKRKLPKLLGEKDVLSIIWFSGRSEFGVLLEAEPVATLTDLNQINAAIDRWLRPVGMTSFLQPIQEAEALMGRISQKYPTHVTSLMMLTDGADNCNNRADILRAVETCSAGLQAATFVEYGYYADRPTLTAMAEKAGGALIFAENFDKFDPLVDAVLQKRIVGGKRIEVTIGGDVIGGFTWTEDGQDLVTFGVQGDRVSVPEQTQSIWYLSPTQVGTAGTDPMEALRFQDASTPAGQKNPQTEELCAACYAAISLFSVRMKPDVVLPFLKITGDVSYIRRFGGLFGKQAYSAFMDEARAACFDASKRLLEGYNPALVPAEDAFTVLDMLRLLASDDANRVLLDHKAFRYSRIGRGSIDATQVLTAEEQAEISRLTAEMAKTRNAAKIQELTDRIGCITASKPEPLKFEADSGKADVGYEVSNLTYNAQTPNISILVRRQGTVDITRHAPDAVRARIPAKFPTFTFRNYAIVKDGLVNVKVLPVRLSASTIAVLTAEIKAGRLPEGVITKDGDTTLLNFDVLPIINRRMVRATSAKALFENEWALLKVQAAQKVYQTTLKETTGTKKSASFEDQYGAEAALWLRDAGFTDYSGFGPKSVQAESTDFYMAKVLDLKIKSFSAIPSLNDWKKQAAKGKFTPSAALLTDAFKKVEAQMATPEGKDPVQLEAWLKDEQKKLDKDRRGMIAQKAQDIFTIVVGGVWPFASPDENQLSMTVDGQTLECTLVASEVQVRI